MARNTYFSQGSVGEKDLYEDMVVEALSIYGQDVYYIPRDIISSDDIINETIESKFNDAYLVEMYIENTDGFDGDGDLLGKFGLEIRDQVSLIVARRSFSRATRGADMVRPKEGDLIYIPLSKSLFELKFVEHEQPFYQLNNLVVYKLQCELFEYRGEDIDTGLGLIDDVQTIHEATTSIGITYTSDVKFKIGEEVNITFADSSIGTSEVLGFDEDQNPIILNLGTLTVTDGTVNKIKVGDTIVGTKSAATATVAEEEDLTTDIYSNDTFDDAADFEAINNNYLDFSELNPFGEPNNNA
jgi:hypothetical protein